MLAPFSAAWVRALWRRSCSVQPGGERDKLGEAALARRWLRLPRQDHHPCCAEAGGTWKHYAPVTTHRDTQRVRSGNTSIWVTRAHQSDGPILRRAACGRAHNRLMFELVLAESRRNGTRRCGATAIGRAREVSPVSRRVLLAAGGAVLLSGTAAAMTADYDARAHSAGTQLRPAADGAAGPARGPLEPLQRATEYARLPQGGPGVRGLHPRQRVVHPQLRRALPGGGGHLLLNSRIRGQPGRKQAHGQEAADALDPPRDPPAPPDPHPLLNDHLTSDFHRWHPGSAHRPGTDDLAAAA